MAQPGDLIERAILEICRDVCELPDRSSPEGEPDQVIVTLEELSDICRNVLTEALSAIPIPATGEVELDHVKASWWDDAIRAHCAEHGPGGDAWNVSMVLERLHRAALTDHTTKEDE